MPYVQRNETGQIAAVSTDKNPAMTEWVELDAPELKDYLLGLAGGVHPPQVANALEESDQALIRVVDDLVNVLVEHNLMRFTDLPEAAQKKLLERRSLRESLTALKLLGDDDHGLI
jgi:hypothetical protein